MTTCPTCGSPVKIVGHTTKHYEPVSETRRHSRSEIKRISSQRPFWAENRIVELEAENAELRKLLTDLEAYFEDCKQVTVVAEKRGKEIKRLSKELEKIVSLTGRDTAWRAMKIACDALEKKDE